MKIGVVIATYQRSDGKTPELLERALKSVNYQTYQNFQVILIGDKYENNEEYEFLSKSIIPEHKIYYENLFYAKEREKYALNSFELWYSGGVNARNYGVDIALKLGLDYVCHLDHDDYWCPEHLQLIFNVISTKNTPAFIYTCSTHINSVLPRVELTNQIIEHLPVPCNLVHSSVCINYKLIPLKYRDVLEETGFGYPADADLWDRLSKYIIENNLKSYLITSVTSFHPTERN